MLKKESCDLRLFGHLRFQNMHMIAEEEFRQLIRKFLAI
jgi:hypothetical protein